jgi:hypothetical protein
MKEQVQYTPQAPPLSERAPQAPDGWEVLGSPETSGPMSPSAAGKSPNKRPPPLSDTPQRSKQAIKSVFLFTDGEANEGVTDTSTIIAIMRDILSGGLLPSSNHLEHKSPRSIKNNASGWFKSASPDKGTDPQNEKQSIPPLHDSNAPLVPVKVHTFGFGDRHNSAMLSAIAEAANGTYYFVRTPEDIPPAFADALGGLLTVAAQTIELRVRAVNRAEIDGIQSGFPQRRDGDTFIVTVPDMYAEEAKDIVVSVKLPEGSEDDVDEVDGVLVGRVEVSFVDVLKGGLGRLEGELVVRRSVDASTREHNSRVTAHVMRMDAVNHMQRAATMAEVGQLSSAQQMLNEMRDRISSLRLEERTSVGSQSVATLSEARMLEELETDLSTLSVNMSSQQHYAQVGRSHTAMCMQSHSYQRSKGMASLPAVHHGITAAIPGGMAPGSSRSLLGRMAPDANPKLPLPMSATSSKRRSFADRAKGFFSRRHNRMHDGALADVPEEAPFAGIQQSAAPHGSNVVRGQAPAVSAMPDAGVVNNPGAPPLASRSTSSYANKRQSEMAWQSVLDAVEDESDDEAT